MSSPFETYRRQMEEEKRDFPESFHSLVPKWERALDSLLVPLLSKDERDQLREMLATAQ